MSHSEHENWKFILRLYKIVHFARRRDRAVLVRGFVRVMLRAGSPPRPSASARRALRSAASVWPRATPSRQPSSQDDESYIPVCSRATHAAYTRLGSGVHAPIHSPDDRRALRVDVATWSSSHPLKRPPRRPSAHAPRCSISKRPRLHCTHTRQSVREEPFRCSPRRLMAGRSHSRARPLPWARSGRE